MEKPHIMICTPMYGGMCHSGYTLGMIGLVNSLLFNNVDVSYEFLTSESLITRARNDLTQKFLNSSATHLLFIDSDISFEPEDIIKMIMADKDIICGAYPKKYINWNKARNGIPQDVHLPQYLCDYVFNSIDEKNRIVDFSKNELISVDNAGTGCMLIKRNVFEKLSDKVPTYISNTLDEGSIVKEYFATSIDPELKVLLSEDYHFCKLWKNFGGEIYIASWVRLKHTGSFVYG